MYAAADLSDMRIRSVTLAPVVDERAFPETQVPIASYIREATGRALARKGYESSVTADPELVRLSEPLLDSSGATLVDRFTAGAPYVLWIGIERVDTESSGGIGLDTRVVLTGTLVDTTNHAVVWRDRAARESSISGAGVAMISPSVRTYEAVLQAVTTLLDSLPDRSG